MSVIRAVDGQDTGLSAQPAEKKKKVEDKKKSVKSKPSASASRPAAVSTDQRFDELDQKWSDPFNRLEALLLARTLDQPQQEPTFGTVKVVPAHSPPASVIRSEPFIRPTNQAASQAADRRSGSTDRPSTSTTTDPPTSRSQSDRQQLSDRPTASDRPSTSISNAFQPTRKISSSESDSDSVVSDRPPVDIFVEEGELSDELDATATDPDHSPSEEQSYKETMRGIRSFMGWTHIPDMDTITGSSKDYPFAGPKLQTPGKISVQLPTDEWLCRKLSKLNLTLTDGYPSCSAEAGGLQRDQFLKPPRSQAKWYGCHPQQKSDTAEYTFIQAQQWLPEDSKTGWNRHQPSPVAANLSRYLEKVGEIRPGVVGYLQPGCRFQ